MSSALHTRLVPSGSFYDDVMSPTSSSSSSSCNFFFEAPRLGPCDLQDPVWTKMSSVAAGVNKKRKKPEAKPQSQINKCLNEKRRREQENIYIEELAELISASFTEMSSLSVKPDKCAILQETVNQIRTIKQQEVTANSDAVQQGEVSSSKPTIIAQEIFGPLLLEALEGFLFVVSKEGNVEFVTDNVTNFLNYSKDEVLGKSIYNFIHHGDHTRFSHVLMPVSSIGWPPVDQAQKNRTFTCRLLVKPPDEQETMEEKQQRVSKYENMQISSTQVPFPGDKTGEGSGGGEECGDFGPCLMCVARRIPQNEKHLQLGAPIEQFTIKLEPGGKIIAVDGSGLSNTYSQYINKELINWNIHDLLHPGDKGKATGYFREMLSSSSSDSVSPIYRLRVSHAQDKYVHVQTKAKFFKCSGGNSAESDFVITTHSIINDNDVVAAEANSPRSCGQSGSGSGSVGGPLMGSVNGNVRTESGNMTMSTSSFTSFSSNNDLNYDFMDFPTSTLVGELGMLTSEERPWERPESRHSTPAPSPHPSFAPAQPSPYQSSIAFPFSPLGDQPPPLEESKEGSRKDSTENGSSSEGDSARLRNLLLMNKRPSVDSDEGGGGGGGASQKNQVLKTLLNHEEEDPGKSRPPSHASDPPTPTPKVSSGNNMLLKLLNEKNDDDDLESRVGLKKQNELLTQLLKDEENKTQHPHIDGQQEDPLLKSLGFSPSPEGVGRARKRPSEEGDEPPAKRGPLSTLDTLPPVSTSAPSNSKLWEKNKMLASLLAKQPSNPTPAQIPPIPASVISATPQDKLPRIIKQQGWSGGSIQQSGAVTRPTQQMVDSVARQRVPQQYQQQQYNNNNSWENQRTTSEQLSDQFLSDILDQVIDIVPDAIATDPASIMEILDQMGEPPVNNSGQFQQTMSEKMAINAIQKSLMQCETVVKSPTYTTNTMGQTQQGFPGPPPMYSTRPRFSLQQTQQITIRPGTPQYAIANQQQQQLLVQQRNKLLQAQQQKQRLLQQQQQQQLLIPINAAASGDGLHNIDSLINNTVAPNVSLQRSSSVPDPQLSPGGLVAGGGGGPMLNSTSQISPSQRQPYSPLSHQPFSPVNSGGISNFQAGGQTQQQQQQQANAQARLSPSGLPTFQQAQLSPRVSQAQQAGGAYTVMSQTSSWPQQQTRLTLQQQQNPMLNAQLTGGAYANNRTFVSQQQPQRPNQPQQLPPVRSLTSPGARQSPFPADGTQYRLQRTISAPPQATTQVPGGVRHNAAYGMKEHHPLLSPSYPPHPSHHPPPHQHQMMYPESSQFCFDQSSLQLYGATTCDRARLPGGAGGNNGMTEYVRQELRAMVGARQQQVRILPGQVSPADFEALGLSFEMSNQGGGESPKMNWGNINSDMSAVSPQSAIQRTGMEEVSRSSDHKSSLLQKLLSE